MLGVLGGMGPHATIDFLNKIVRNTQAAWDQDHIPMVICSAPNIPDRTAAIVSGGDDPLPAMRDALRALERAGATCVAIPCNTAHYWHGVLQAETSIPILHIVDAVVQALTRDGLHAGPIGVLATDGTISAGIYHYALAHHGFVCSSPNHAGQIEVMRAIRLVKAGQFAEASEILAGQADRLLFDGCHRVVMACTEIPLVLGVSCAALLDATDALARASIEAYKGGLRMKNPSPAAT